jgi:probable addiction module antidote protein
MIKSNKYQDHLIESLKDPEHAAAYLSAALEENEPKLFLLALRNVTEAVGGVSKLSKATKLNRENLYRMLSKKGNPELYSLALLLDKLGLKLAVDVKAESSL